MNLLKYAKQLAVKNKAANSKNLPALFFFTDRKSFKDIFSIIVNLPKGTAIVVREYDLSYEQRLIFAKKIKLLIKNKSLKLLIAKDLSLALKIKADGVHFSDHDISWMSYLRYKKNSRKKFIFTIAAHKISSIIKAQNLGLDAVFYSPIFPTKSHPKERAIGILNLAKIVRKVKIPVFALGGINDMNVKLLLNCKIAGIAGIRF